MKFVLDDFSKTYQENSKLINTW